MYQTILVPLDNSWADDTILNHVKALAHLMGSRLILLHVADGMVARNQEQLNLDDSDEIRCDRRYLEERRASLAREGVEVSARLACGAPTDHIVSVAAEEHCDLIAMATHGHRLVKDVVLGSVASAVRHRTNIPVLLVRASKPQSV